MILKIQNIPLIMDIISRSSLLLVSLWGIECKVLSGKFLLGFNLESEPSEVSDDNSFALQHFFSDVPFQTSYNNVELSFGLHGFVRGISSRLGLKMFAWVVVGMAYNPNNRLESLFWLECLPLNQLVEIHYIKVTISIDFTD